MIAVNKKIRFFIVSLTVLVSLMGCDEKAVYHHYKPTLLAGWKKTDTLTFNIPPIEITANYQVSVGIRTTVTCPYQSLWLVVRQDFTPNALSRIDTIECKLANDKGEIIGQGVINYLHTFPLCTETLYKGQTGKIRIYHIMRREELPGISQIGIKISN